MFRVSRPRRTVALASKAPKETCAVYIEGERKRKRSGAVEGTVEKDMLFNRSVKGRLMRGCLYFHTVSMTILT